MAVVPAADASRDVPPALEAVAAGAIYLSRSCTVELRQVLDRAATPASGLAPREIETLAWIARGCTHRQVAHHMQVTEATVNTYVKRLRSKLGVGNKAELAQAAWRLGLMENSPGPVVSSTVHRSERVDVDVSRT
jgi:DNA-binding NarL/FixJ family response regulator